MFAEETRIENLFIRCKGSIEKCKQTIDMYYTLRSVLPEIFCNRDPYEPWFKQVTSLRYFVKFEIFTATGLRVG
jgi:hypothetical protein